MGANGANASPMAWSGRIASSIFRGPRQSMVVEAGALRLNVEASALLGARVGDDVRLDVPIAGAWAIRSEVSGPS
jgi:iron(III) transport system ATP-binding protein